MVSRATPQCQRRSPTERRSAAGSRHSSPRISGTAPSQDRAPALSPSNPSVHRQVRALLEERGWAQGRTRDRKGRVDLLGAVEAVLDQFETDQPTRRLVRRARILNHLREMASTSDLAVWNDARGRTIAYVYKLLERAANAFPDD